MENNKKRKNTLFSLEQGLLGDKSAPKQSPQPRKKKRKPPKKKQKHCQTYDSGEAIKLEYNSAAFPSATPEAMSSSSYNSFASDLEDESLPFTVEAFEADEEPSPVSEPSYGQTSLEPEIKDEEPAPVSEPSYGQTSLEPEIEPEVASEQMEVQPVQGTVVPPSETPSSSTSAVEPPPTVEPTTAQAELSDAQDFAEDLQAILKGEKTYDAEEKQVVSTSPTPPPVSPAHPHDIFDKGKATTPSPQPIQPEPAPMSRSHAIFDQIGQKMAHATDFDQGTLELSLEQTFDEFDQILDEEESKPHEQPMAQMMTKGELEADAKEVEAEDETNTYTVCFCGTDCTRDEGEESRTGSSLYTGSNSDKQIYSDSTGYIPVRIHTEISGGLEATAPSITVRGVGVNDWHDSGNSSDDLDFRYFRKLIPKELRTKHIKPYSSGDQRSKLGAQEATGWPAVALALHGANKAALSKASQFNFIGHSRGAVECIMAAWFLYAYGGEIVRETPVNIFAIDPVPGPGNWYGMLTQLPPNVANYVGIYAWDHVGFKDTFAFTALVPRPNAGMLGEEGEEVEKLQLGKTWQTLADKHQLQDPLAPAELDQPSRYKLYSCRGKHSTVAGNYTADGGYKPEKINENVERVPKLVYKLAREYLTEWGTTFTQNSKVEESKEDLKADIHENHEEFDKMGGSSDRNRKTDIVNRLYVRRVSSAKGRDPSKKLYLEDVVGEPREGSFYPVTKKRNLRQAGWVKWKFL
ncbi:MAG: hypothetical protein AAFQ80_16240 [Cyanobacteria bacterium J06621_8]